MPSRRQFDARFGLDMMAACRTEALSKVYGRRDTAVHALREVTLSIPPRAFSAIMGPSGSGKSTLLHCLAALDTPSSGKVFLGHTELSSLSRRQQAQVRRDRIGFVFQAFNLVPTLDAIENITLPQLLAGRRPDKDWLEYVVAQIGLGDRLHHRPSQLSGGQQQRVALARALAGRPEVIFADEPTGNLDTRASREMLALLRSAVDDFGQTVVTVTHDPGIAGYADQVLFFTDGQVVDQMLQPETSLVLDRLQYLDSSTPAHVSPRGQLHASTQWDGQHTMRSRRRRRTDDAGPGRPMVGTDDEVEVARQERWLQRIREQFEVEHEEPTAGAVRPGATPAANGAYNGAPAPSDLQHSAYDQPANGYRQPAQLEPTTGASYANGAANGRAAHHEPSPWLPAVRGELMGDNAPANGTAPPTQTDDAWSHTATTAATDLPPDAAPQWTGNGWDTSRAAQPAGNGWDTSAPTQRWDPPAAATDDPWQTGGSASQGAWQPAETGRFDTRGAQRDGWQAPAANGAPNGHWDRSQATPDAGPDAWSDSGEVEDGGWAEIMPSQPPAAQWGTSPPPTPPNVHDARRARRGGWDPWDPEGAEPVANGHANGTNGYTDEPPAHRNGTNGYGADPAPNGNGTNGYGADPAPNGYGTNGYGADPTPNGYGADPTPNGYGAHPTADGPARAGETGQAPRYQEPAPAADHGVDSGRHAPYEAPVDSYGAGASGQGPRSQEPAPSTNYGAEAVGRPNGTADAWNAAPPPAEAHDDAAQVWTGEDQTEWAAPEDVEVVEEPDQSEHYDIWAPRAGGASRAADPSTHAGATPHAGQVHYADDHAAYAGDDAAYAADGPHTAGAPPREAWGPGPEDTTWTPNPPEPEMYNSDAATAFDRVDPAPTGSGGAPWGGDSGDDPYRPEPRMQRRFDDTSTDPFEALHSLQSQLNRLGTNSRRPRRHPGG